MSSLTATGLLHSMAPVTTVTPARCFMFGGITGKLLLPFITTGVPAAACGLGTRADNTDD